MNSSSRTAGEPLKFIILMGGSRVGSTLLVDQLNRSPFIYCGREILERVCPNPGPGSAGRLTGIAGDFFEKPGLHTQIRKRLGLLKAAGFKTRLNPWVWNETSLAELRGRLLSAGLAKVICLTRRNRVKQAVSHFRALEFAKEAGRHNTKKPDQLAGLAPLQIDIPLLRHILETFERQTELVRDFADGLGLPCLHLLYEDLAGRRQESVDGVFRFLGVAPEKFRLPGKTYVKMTPDDLSAVISNYGRMAAALRGTPYETMLTPSASPSSACR